jgi:hypothetical protein
MGAFLRWGNWAVAKFMEFLFNSTNLTDVGCTMRVIRRDALEKISPHFSIAGSAFGPEMMILSLLFGLRVIQVPVNYLPRVGSSSVTGDPLKAVALGLWMIQLVVTHRVRSWAMLFAHGSRRSQAFPRDLEEWDFRDSEVVFQARAAKLDLHRAQAGEGALQLNIAPEPWRRP